MAKNQINFSKMTEETHTQLITFKESALAIAVEDLRFKAEMKPLKAQLENILANRQNDLDNGLSVEEVSAKFPRIEVDNKIRNYTQGYCRTTHKVYERYLYLYPGRYA